jgi:hypothetical protein
MQARNVRVELHHDLAFKHPVGASLGPLGCPAIAGHLTEQAVERDGSVRKADHPRRDAEQRQGKQGVAGRCA